MNLTRLKWTKNVNRADEEWAYSHKDGVNTFFKLHWKPDSYKNAASPEAGDLAILRQKARVTHVVEFIDNAAPQEDPEDNEWIYRWVKVIWIADVWHEPSHQDLIFDCSLQALQGGNIMKLENIQSIQQRWQSEGGIANFQKHIQRKLRL